MIQTREETRRESECAALRRKLTGTIRSRSRRIRATRLEQILTGDRAAAERSGGRIAAERSGNQATTERGGDQVATETSGDQVATERSGDQSAAERSRDQVAAERSGHQLVAGRSGDRETEESRGPTAGTSDDQAMEITTDRVAESSGDLAANSHTKEAAETTKDKDVEITRDQAADKTLNMTSDAEIDQAIDATHRQAVNDDQVLENTSVIWSQTAEGPFTGNQTQMDATISRHPLKESRGNPSESEDPQEGDTLDSVPAVHSDIPVTFNPVENTLVLQDGDRLDCDNSAEKGDPVEEAAMLDEDQAPEVKSSSSDDEDPVPDDFWAQAPDEDLMTKLEAVERAEATPDTDWEHREPGPEHAEPLQIPLSQAREELGNLADMRIPLDAENPPHVENPFSPGIAPTPENPPETRGFVSQDVEMHDTETERSLQQEADPCPFDGSSVPVFEHGNLTASSQAMDSDLGQTQNTDSDRELNLQHVVWIQPLCQTERSSPPFVEVHTDPSRVMSEDAPSHTEGATSLQSSTLRTGEAGVTADTDQARDSFFDSSPSHNLSDSAELNFQALDAVSSSSETFEPANYGTTDFEEWDVMLSEDEEIDVT